jgi:dihydrolipoamide dehydrogenase
MKKQHTDIVVIGAGPGGYAAAFYAADHGKKVLLIEQDENLGGVCLNRGCIPSKALLNVSKILKEAKHAEKWGLQFDKPTINLDTMRTWKNGVIDKLSGGIRQIGKARNVTILKGRAHFEGSQELRVETEAGQERYTFDHAILASGSRPALPGAFDLGNPRIMTSTEALELPDIPETLLVVGGGYIGMELGTVYATLGSKVTVVEAAGSLLSGADADLVRPVAKYAQGAFEEILLNTKVQKMATKGKQIAVTFEDGKVTCFDRVLVSIGRSPNSQNLGLENTKVIVDDRGYVKASDTCQTDDANIYAIGDVIGGAMLAHKASKEARIAVANICGDIGSMKNVVLPAVVFTMPEVAWCGLTENEAKAKNITVQVGKFPWAASGRALTMDHAEGLTKLIIEPGTERILGVGIVGHGAGELIGEAVLAVEMGATAYDIGSTVHAHPTLSETIMEAAEVFFGHSAHAAPRKAL